MPKCEWVNCETEALWECTTSTFNNDVLKIVNYCTLHQLASMIVGNQVLAAKRIIRKAQITPCVDCSRPARFMVTVKDLEERLLFCAEHTGKAISYHGNDIESIVPYAAS